MRSTVSVARTCVMREWDWDSRDDGRRPSASPFSKEQQVGRRGPAVAKKPRRTREVAEAQELFKVVVCADDCLLDAGVYGECEFPLQAAHVVPAAELRKRGLDHLVYDPVNAIALCYRHHRRHDNWTEKIPQHLLPARCFAWAAAHGLTEVLEHHWPASTTADSGGVPKSISTYRGETE